MAKETSSGTAPSNYRAAELMGVVDSSVAMTLPMSDGEERRKRRGEDKPSYYDLSILKPPVWEWQIAWYFFLGGLSAGAYVLGRLGETIGGKKHRDLTRLATYISAAAALPCAPLLIDDLGDPMRFHHMLRVFKPSSPMSLGSWTLTGYSAMCFMAALREFVRVRRGDEPIPTVPGRMLDRTLMVSADIFGIPLAILLAGYTGILLSTTANPLWGKNKWLGALFSASAMHSAASAVRLALELHSGSDTPSAKALTKIDHAANIAEAVAIAGYVVSAGELAAPVTKGKQAKNFLGGAIGLGIICPTIIEHLPLPKKAKRYATIAGCLLGLVGGLALRWAMVYGGHDSANNPDDARLASKRSEQ